MHGVMVGLGHGLLSHREYPIPEKGTIWDVHAVLELRAERAHRKIRAVPWSWPGSKPFEDSDVFGVKRGDPMLAEGSRWTSKPGG